MELIDKEKVLKENIKDIAQLDEAILLIDEQHNGLTAERNQIEENRKTTKIDENLISTWNRMDINDDSNKCEKETEQQKESSADVGQSSQLQNGKNRKT